MVKVIEVLLFNGESNVPCVRHSDYVALEAENDVLGVNLNNCIHRAETAEARCRELEAALKLVACNCNGEAGCKSYELYYKLCPAPETVVKP